MTQLDYADAIRQLDDRIAALQQQQPDSDEGHIQAAIQHMQDRKLTLEQDLEATNVLPRR